MILIHIEQNGKMLYIIFRRVKTHRFTVIPMETIFEKNRGAVSSNRGFLYRGD